MIESKSEGGNFSGSMNPKRLKKMMETTGAVGMISGESAQLVKFDSEEAEKTAIYDYLWVSERFYLRGICMFLSSCQQDGPRVLAHDPAVPLNCVFNDILRLDFTKYKQVLEEHQDETKEHGEKWQREHEQKHAKKEAEEGQEENKSQSDMSEYAYPIGERTGRMTEFLHVMVYAAKYALNSKSWL
jgi:hypothetical protein